ncbi:MAG: DUF4055 domain-containing protein, partial [Novosphingobium sp.]
MPVTTTHPDYDRHLPEWQAIDAALAGEAAIKSDAKNLPKPAGMVEAEKIDVKNGYLYKGYTERAQYEHWVRDSLRSMMGLVSRLQPEIELPPGMEGMRENATDDGFGLRQLFMRVVRQIVSHGRVPMLANIDDKGLPYISTYRAENGINWKDGNQSGRSDLTLAVMRETRAKDDSDEFSHEVDTVYRVLSMRDGVCYTRVEDGEGTIVEEERPLGTADSGGQLVRALEYIPVIYCGSTDNGPDVDEVPLLSMARAALKSYQLSADYFTALHQTSHPQPWVSGLSDDKDLSVTGPSAAWDLGENGSCGYLEFQGAGVEAVRTAMADQKNAALEAGAKVMDVGGTESGEARKARQNDQHATLHSIVVTAAEAIEQALRFAADWLGYPEENVKFTVDPTFVLPQIDPQVAQQLQQAVLSGGVSWETYWFYLVSGRLPEHEYSKELLRIDNPGNIVD